MPADASSTTSAAGVGELEQVVSSADHCPFGSDLFEAAEQELAEASGIFDLAEHGFDGLLSQTIPTAAPGELELVGHSGLARAFRPCPKAGGMGLTVACPTG